MAAVQGTFLERPNRFVARVRLETGEEVAVHVASSGRLPDVLLPGVPVWVEVGDPAPGRRTAGRLLLARVEESWVSVDTSVPGRIFRRAFAAGALEPFAEYREWRPEVPFGRSRLDFCLTGEGLPACWVEVKSVTSVERDADGVRVGRFPDAPTTRGQRHLHELVDARRQGHRAAVCFIVQREDAEAFGPWAAVDPAFAEALREAAGAGVEVYAWRLRVRPGEEIGLGPMLPVRL